MKMNRKFYLSILIYLIIFLLIILTLRGALPLGQVLLGFFLFGLLVISGMNVKNRFVLITIALLISTSLYFSIKLHLSGAMIGGLASLLVAISMHFGWIVPHKPFSRSQYIKSQEKERKSL